MVKHEIKVEFNDSNNLKEVIEKSYFDNGLKGKLTGKINYLKVNEDDINYTIFKNLDGATAKLTNDIVDGSIRVIVDESNNDIRLYPISIYCIKENDKYIFY